ncbi:hypothetical protein GCM10010405_14090 [Streptomyces macrosporus]|uniref:Uncharacterized protein n=1 Tax=Streptomyces macrosporus TaxID=44032 RepID=A0ABP5WRD0_9ACTN
MLFSIPESGWWLIALAATAFFMIGMQALTNSTKLPDEPRSVWEQQSRRRKRAFHLVPPVFAAAVLAINLLRRSGSVATARGRARDSSRSRSSAFMRAAVSASVSAGAGPAATAACGAAQAVPRSGCSSDSTVPRAEASRHKARVRRRRSGPPVRAASGLAPGESRSWEATP